MKKLIAVSLLFILNYTLHANKEINNTNSEKLYEYLKNNSPKTGNGKYVTIAKSLTLLISGIISGMILQYKIHKYKSKRPYLDEEGRITTQVTIYPGDLDALDRFLESLPGPTDPRK